MAYKFQIGAAKFSGSIEQTDGSSIKAQSEFQIGSTAVDETELAILEGATVSTAELNYLDGADANLNTLSLPASTTITSFAASILDDADEATFKATVNLEIGTDVQAQDAGLQYLADLTITNEATFQEQVGLEIGVDVQAYDADLDNLSGMQAGASAALALLTSTEVEILDGATVTTSELNLLDDITRGSLLYGNSSGASAELAAGAASTVLASDGTDIGYFQIDNSMVDSSAGIQLSKLESVSSANIIVGNGSNVATAVAMSGDVAIDNAGATTIQANAVEGSMINSNAAGDGLDYSSNALNVAVSGAVHVSSDKVSITGSFAGPGLSYEGGVDSISKVALNFSSLAVEETTASNLGSTDLFSYFDTADSTQRKVAVPVVRDRIYSDVSGDATIAAGGALTIAAGAVEGTMLNSNTAGDGIQIASNAIAVDVSDFAGTGLEDDGSENLRLSAQGTGIAGGAGSTLSVAAAQTSIQSIYNSSLVLGYGASDAHIDFSTDNEIQFDIDNTATLNLSSQGIDLQQGGIQVPAAADIDAAGAGAVNFMASIGANNLTIGGASSTVVIPGNLTVTGTTVEVDAAFVVTSSIQFEGTTPDGNEISLTSADPTTDRTITLPDLDGHIPLLAGAASAADVTYAEFALLDGDSSVVSATVVDGDAVLFNDGGVMKHLRVQDMATYVGNNLAETVQTITALTATIDMANGAQVLANNASAQTLTLPAASAMEGKMLKIKRIGAGEVTISANGAENIDGQSGDIVLESAYGAVSIISDGSNYFIV